MDLSRLLALLFCMVTFQVQDIQTRPVDFVCDDHARRDMNMVKELETVMNDCNGSVLLPSPIQLPCVKINKASWGKKSTQEKRGDILAALGTLAQGVRVTRTLTTPGCQFTLLERLEHSITNYVHIVTHLELTGKVESAVTNCPSQDTQNLGQVLRHFSWLLTGKLEWLIAELKTQCQVERLTSNL